MSNVQSLCGLHHKFIQDQLSKLQSVTLYWSINKKTYYTEEFVANAIRNTVIKHGIIDVDSIPSIINTCGSQKIALQMAQLSNNLGCLNCQFLFSHDYQSHIKQSVITIMRNASHINTMDDLQRTLIANINTMESNTYDDVLRQLFKTNQFASFVDGILISLSDTHVSLRVHWNQQLQLIQSNECHTMILDSIPSDTAIITFHALQRIFTDKHDILGINPKLLSYLLPQTTSNAFKLCKISEQTYIISNTFYDLRLKRIHSILQHQGFITQEMLLNHAEQYLFKDSKQMHELMHKYTTKHSNICQISNGYVNSNVLCAKYIDMLIDIIKQNQICSTHCLYETHIKSWIGDLDASSQQILTQKLNIAVQKRDESHCIMLRNDHWIVSVIPNCIWTQHLQWMTQVFVDRNALRCVLNDSNERNVLSRGESVAIVKYLCSDLCALDAPSFVNIVIDILQNKICEMYRRQKQDRTAVNKCQDMSKQWKRFAKIIATLYEHFGCLLRSIRIIEVAEEIRSELLNYLVDTVFGKIVNTVLVAYGCIVGIDLNEHIKGFNLTDNSYEFTKSQRECVLDAISTRFKASAMNERFSMLFKVKCVVDQFENVLQNGQWINGLKSVYLLCSEVEGVCKQLLLSRFIKQSIEEHEESDAKNDKFVAMYSRLKEQLLCMDLSDVTNIKPFIQMWIVLYFYEKHSVIVHIPSASQSIANITNYLKNTCDIDASVIKLCQCMDNKELRNQTDIEQLATNIKSLYR
eukprot:533288_1